MKPWLFPLLLIATTPAAAFDPLKEPAPFNDYEFEEKRWEEVEAQLPPAPQPQNLAKLVAGITMPHRYLLDRSSLALGADGVVRYIIVVETTGGARNVSYEGLRCDTKENKLYAFGKPDGSWAKNKYARWNPITVRGNSYAALLYNEYFCAGGELPALERIHTLLKQGGYQR